ncbi:SPL family radical SAM protein [Marinicella sp. W31]|uniref:SPL family radical SAM protein n=1 Tax=Marinicella sp. W31 TaxID=3023713 RepID=UPI003756971E
MPKEIQVKSVLNKTKRRDPWFLDDYTINLYSSCSFNCLYCYIRGSQYGTHLEKSVSVKSNALEVLDRQLASRAKKGEYGIIVLSSATDAYLQFESEYRLTRQALELILKYRFPVHIITKSDLVVRDFDLLQNIATVAKLPSDLSANLNTGAIVTFSFSCLDDQIARIFEPGATRPSARLRALEQSQKAGLLTGVSLMPLLPFISDNGSQLIHYFETFSAIGINHIFPATLGLFGHLPSDSKTLTLAAVAKHYPELLKKYQGYFANSNRMPQFYRQAFEQKMQSLCAEYNLKRSIL